MAQLYSTRTEKKALKLICSETKASDWLFGKLDDAFFASKETRTAFKRIKLFARKRGEIMTWDDLCEDPALEEDIRSGLKNFKSEVETTRGRAKIVFNRLNEYRQLRAFAESHIKVDEMLKAPNVNLDSLRETYDNALNKSRTGAEQRMYTIGDKRTRSVVKNILRGAKNSAIPTGFSVFDKKNRGIFRGSLFLLAASSGGGKSAVVSQNMDDMTQWGASVVMFSLEMTEIEQYMRALSRRTKVSMEKLIDAEHKLTNKERLHIYKQYREYEADLIKRRVKHSVISPDSDITIEDALHSVKHKGYDVIIIDYISLLSGADGDDQVRKLGAITRYAKIFAKNNNCVVILLAQINDEGLVKYSRAIVENSNNAWLWKRDDESKATHIIDVDQIKARNQSSFRFKLLEEFETMTIRDVPKDYEPPERPEIDEQPRKGGKTVKVRRKEFML